MSDLKAQIEKRLKELQHDCALQRLHLRNAHGGGLVASAEIQNVSGLNGWRCWKRKSVITSQ